MISMLIREGLETNLWCVLSRKKTNFQRWIFNADVRARSLSYWQVKVVNKDEAKQEKPESDDLSRGWGSWYIPAPGSEEEEYAIVMEQVQRKHWLKKIEELEAKENKEKMRAMERRMAKLEKMVKKLSIK